jgi:hypothetical protein
VLCHPNVFFGHDLTWRSSKRAHLLAAVTCPLKEMAMMMNPLEFQKYFLKQLNVFIFILFYIKII